MENKTAEDKFLNDRLGLQYPLSIQMGADIKMSPDKIASLLREHASQQCAELQKRIEELERSLELERKEWSRKNEENEKLQSENESLKKQVEEQTYQLEFAEREVAKRNALLEDVVYDRVQMQEVKRRIEDILNLPF